MKPTLTVSVGVPAYNEESNIQYLLSNIESQEEKNFIITEIIIVSDASTDNTGALIEKFAKKSSLHIRLIRNQTRKGQNVCQNIILNKARGDIVVLLEADSLLKSKDGLFQLIFPILFKRADASYAHSIPLESRSFIGKTLTFVEKCKSLSFLRHKNGKNIFTCHSGKALTRQFAEEFRWTPNIPEDSFFYLSSLRLRKKILFSKNALIYFMPPQTMKDYILKTTKFKNGVKLLKNYFPANLLKKESSLSYLYFIALFSQLIKNPVYTSMYTLLYLASVIYKFSLQDYTSKWEISYSTKLLIDQYEK